MEYYYSGIRGVTELATKGCDRRWEGSGRGRSRGSRLRETICYLKKAKKKPSVGDCASDLSSRGDPYKTRAKIYGKHSAKKKEGKKRSDGAHAADGTTWKNMDGVFNY